MVGESRSHGYAAVLPVNPGRAAVVWLAFAALGWSGEITFHRHPWWGQYLFSYEDRAMRIEFGVRTVVQVASTRRVRIKTDDGLRTLLASVVTYPAPSNPKLNEQLRIEPKGEHFDVWNAYRPADSRANRFPPARGGVRLGPRDGEMEVWVTWQAWARGPVRIDACGVELATNEALVSVRLYPSGEDITVSAAEPVNRTVSDTTGWLCQLASGTVVVVLSPDGTSPALFSKLPQVAMSLGEKRRNIRFRFPAVGPISDDGALAAHWRMRVAPRSNAADELWQWMARQAQPAKQQRQDPK